MNYLHIGHPETYLCLAYRVDHRVATLTQRVAPGSWPASYLANDVRERPWGIFYPEQSTLTVKAWSPEPIRGLEIESFFPSATRMTVEIDGQVLGEERVQPGLRAIRLREPRVFGPPGQETRVRLSFPDEPTRPAGHLWPVRVAGLSSSEQADPPRWK